MRILGLLLVIIGILAAVPPAAVFLNLGGDLRGHITQNGMVICGGWLFLALAVAGGGMALMRRK